MVFIYFVTWKGVFITPFLYIDHLHYIDHYINSWKVYYITVFPLTGCDLNFFFFNEIEQIK